MQTDHEELARRVSEGRPPMWVCLLAAFGVWTLVGITGHVIADNVDASDRFREVFNDLSFFSAIVAVWYWRYEPVAAAIRALKEAK